MRVMISYCDKAFNLCRSAGAMSSGHYLGYGVARAESTRLTGCGECAIQDVLEAAATQLQPCDARQAGVGAAGSVVQGAP